MHNFVQNEELTAYLIGKDNVLIFILYSLYIL